jgi:hypothetical protein
MKMKGRMPPSLGLWGPRSSESVFVVSSKLTWNEGFPAHKLSYRKRKMVPSAMVDIEEIKRQVIIQLLGDLRHIFESQGLPMSDIGAVGNEEERRSSLASTAATPNTKFADQGPAGSVPQ